MVLQLQQYLTTHKIISYCRSMTELKIGNKKSEPGRDVASLLHEGTQRKPKRIHDTEIIGK